MCLIPTIFNNHHFEKPAMWPSGLAPGASQRLRGAISAWSPSALRFLMTPTIFGNFMWENDDHAILWWLQRCLYCIIFCLFCSIGIHNTHFWPMAIRQHHVSGAVESDCGPICQCPSKWLRQRWSEKDLEKPRREAICMGISSTGNSENPTNFSFFCGTAIMSCVFLDWCCFWFCILNMIFPSVDISVDYLDISGRSARTSRRDVTGNDWWGNYPQMPKNPKC